MISENNNRDTSAVRIRNLTDENEVLFRQLHDVQEALELRRVSGEPVAGIKSDEAVKQEWSECSYTLVLAENYRLQALHATKDLVRQAEAQNALNIKLGNLLIKSVQSPQAMLALPRKLYRIWHQSKQQKLASLLGGKNFSKVIEAYTKGGFEAVEQLFDTASIAPVLQANALTVLARHLHIPDIRAEAARRAYLQDPQPYRLKWLAFRMYEADKPIEAESMLDALPTDMSFSESEIRQVNKLRDTAKQLRLYRAKQDSGYKEYSFAFEEVKKQRKQIKALSAINQQLEQEKGALVLQNQSVEHMDKLREQKKTLEKKTEQLERKVEALSVKNQQFEQEKEALIFQQEQSVKRLDELRRQKETLEKKIEQLERENSALATESASQAKLSQERLILLNTTEGQLHESRATCAETAAHLQLLKEELARAEGQIDIVREMFFRRT